MSASKSRVAAPRWRRALVTGASSGIGEAFARQLAEAGTDLVIVARDLVGLQRLADELGATHGVSVDVMSADLSAPVSRAAVEKRLSDDQSPIDLLVNNAGFGTAGTFTELPLAREEQQVQLNVVAVLRLTSVALEGMVARQRGNVINVSSIAGRDPSPGAATYGATKAFVSSFTAAVNDELAGTGVRVTEVLPGLTRTHFHDRPDTVAPSRLPERAWLSAEQVAGAALAAAAAGRSSVVPGGGYRALMAATGVVPDVPRRWLIARARRITR